MRNRHTTGKTNRPPLLFLLVVGAVLFVVTRLWLFAGQPIAPDSDEAILGVMVNLLRHGQGQLLFLGQNYGIAPVEQAAGVCASLMSSGSPHTTNFIPGIGHLKLLTGIIWLFAWQLLAIALYRVHGSVVAWCGGLMLLVAPAWALWSCKARAPYMTAMCAFVLAIYLLSDHVARRLERQQVEPDPFQPDDQPPAAGPPDDGVDGHAAPPAKAAAGSIRSRRRWPMGWFIIGTCLAMLYWSQPFWAPGLLVFVVAGLMATRSPLFSRLGLLFVGACLAHVVLRGLVHLQADPFWQPDVIKPNLPAALIALPEQMFTHLTGAWYYTRSLTGEAGMVTRLAGVLWLLLLALAVILPWVVGHATASRAERVRLLFARAGSLSVLATIALNLLIDPQVYSYRYLLPVTVFAIWPLGWLMDRLWASGGKKRVVVAAMTAITLCSLGAFADLRSQVPLVRTPRHIVWNVDEVYALITALEREGIANVYTPSEILEWELMYLSQGGITARGLSNRGRYARFARDVEAARRSPDELAAIIEDSSRAGDLRRFFAARGFDSDICRPMTDRFVIIRTGDEAVLGSLGFEPVADP